ncbi:hypothetical protein AAXB25_15170 [Paenibacillus lautus]|uniref:hypothetical protein n=1 Tax=Paenibacillus lautus TaxID=1401 RepID=UPI003D2C8955
MTIFFGIVGIIAGIIAGLYLGLYVCFIGGGIDIIRELVNVFNGDPVSGIAIMWGIVKMAIAGAVGWLSFYAFLIPSSIALGWKSK